MKSFPDNITIGDKYGPAMQITEQAEADDYFLACVEHTMRHGADRAKAESIERGNLGYFAGYCNDEIRERVERLFRCAHPIFGSIVERGVPSPEAAFEAGRALGVASREQGNR